MFWYLAYHAGGGCFYSRVWYLACHEEEEEEEEDGGSGEVVNAPSSSRPAS